MNANKGTNRILFILLILLIRATIVPAQEKTDAKVFGYVVSAQDGAHIPFINVLIEGARIGTITDASGHFILANLPEGQHTLVVKGMGYETESVEFEISADQTFEIYIEVSYTGVDLDEVVITASPTASGFRYQPDMKYTGESLQRRSEVSFGEMLNHSPGMAMRSMGSSPARPVIRGMDGDRILMLENGERMGDISDASADHSIALDPLVANSIEVVRGPASLLYGSSALGGVINLMTTDIPDRWDRGSSGIVSLQGASMNRMVAGFGRYTYGSDNWSVTGRLAHRQSSDITTPDGVLPGTSMNNIDGGLGFGFKNGRTVGGASLSLANQRFEIPENIDDPDVGVEIRMQRQALQGRANFESNGFFDRGQIRFNASRMFQQEIEYEWEDGLLDEYVELEYEKYAFSSTFTIQHRPFEFLDRGALGLNLHGYNLDVGSDESYTPGERRMNLGLFTFQEIPLTKRIRLQAGFRLDFQHTRALTYELFSDISSSRDVVNYTGSIGFNHRPVKELEIGGQFASSHRNPSVEELYAQRPHLGAGMYVIGDATLKDEIGQGADLFVRWTGGSLRLEAAWFVNYFRNYIIFEPVGETDVASGLPVFRYTGDGARLLGGEFSASFNVARSMVMEIGFDYVDGRRFRNDTEYLPFIPPLRLMAELEYDFGPFWMGGKAVLATSQNRVAPEEDVTDGYTLLGLSAGYRVSGPGNHLIIFRVDNMLNQRYRDHIFRVTARNFPMPGRNFSLAYRLFF